MTAGTPAEELLSRLEKVKPRGDGWTARCPVPAHGDGRPSLKVDLGPDGRVLVRCYANCPAEEIVAAVGLTMADLFDESTRANGNGNLAGSGDTWTPHGAAIETYLYADEGGKLLRGVCRTADKQFPQWRPDSSSKSGRRWGGISSVRVTLYRLPQLAARIAAGNAGKVHVVEGERDVHAIEQAGGVATTSPGGAGKWRSELAEQLRGFDAAVVVADRDLAGLRHAQTVAASLIGIVPDVQTVWAKTGKDSRDHLAASHGLNEFIPIDVGEEIARHQATEGDTADSLPEPAGDDTSHNVGPPMVAIETWAEFRESADGEPRQLIEGVVAEATYVYLAGRPKGGKTWVALGAAISIATGKPFVGFNVPAARPVVYVALEGHRAAIRARIGCLARGFDLDPDSDDLANLHILYKPIGINLGDPAWTRAIHEAAAALEAAIVFIDVLRAAAPGLRENEGADFAMLRSNLQPMHASGIATMLLHHFTKLSETSKERVPGERMSGHGSLFGAIDTGIYVTGSEKGARSLRLEFDVRDIASPDPIGIRLIGEGSGENNGFIYTDRCDLIRTSSSPDEDSLKAPPGVIAAWIRERGGEARPSEIREQFEMSDGTWSHRAKELIDRYGFTKVGKTGPAIRYVALPTSMFPAANEADPDEFEYR